MIKTLRITSIIAAIAAAVLLILPVVYGIGENSEVEELIKAPGAVERFKNSKGQGRSKPKGQESPLVKQAKAFALYLDPPAPVAKTPQRPARPNTHRPEPVRPSSPVSSKFDLVATSLFSSRPELSLILVDEPGEGMHWVRQGDKIGHLVVKEVKSGSVVMLDGQRTFELEVERESQISLIRDPSAPARQEKITPSPSGVPEPVRTTTTPSRTSRRTPARTPARSTRRSRTSRETVPPTNQQISSSEDSRAALEEILEQERSEGSQESAAMIEELLKSLTDSSSLSTEEAAELEKLGQELEQSEISEESMP